MVSLSRIAEVSGGEILGDSGFEIAQLHSLESAAPDSLTFCVDPLKNPYFSSSKAGAMIIAPQYADLFPGHKILSKNPYLAYAKVSALFKKKPGSLPYIHPSAIISASAVLGDNVFIGPLSCIEKNTNIGEGAVIGSGVYIGSDVVVGKQTEISSGVVIQDRCVIGERCVISPGVVIGSDGFGYAANGQQWQKIEQLGIVIIGDDVDIGANTTIDRGSIGNTSIASGVKLDNQIQIAHNVQIGENTVVAACVGIAGSAKIGKRCRIAGKASILGHLEIVDDVTILVDSLVVRSISQAGEYGSMLPSQPIGQWRKNVAVLRRLEKLAKKVSALRGHK